MNAITDACMACFPGDAPAAIPSAMHASADGTITADYSCSLCGLAWRTTWTIADAWPQARVYARPLPLLDEVMRLLTELLDGEELEPV